MSQEMLEGVGLLTWLIGSYVVNWRLCKDFKQAMQMYLMTQLGGLFIWFCSDPNKFALFG